MPSISRRARLIGAAVALVGGGVGVAAATGAFGPSAAQIAAERAAAQAARAAAAAHRLLVTETRVADRAARHVAVALPSRTGAPAPAVPAQLFSTPLPRHAVYGFVPYWELGALNATDYSDTSVLPYFGVEIGATGGILRSGNGWLDLATPAFTSFVASAHHAGDRVLLTASTTDPAVVDDLARASGQTGARLGGQLATVVVAEHLDGIDLDVEGRSTSDRAGFVRFVSAVATAFRRADPTGQVALDTYPGSAGDASDFFDVAQLARDVDTVVVMAYDMVDPAVASANSPLASPTLGLSDVGSLLDYVKVVPAAKLVLALPFYGYDFTTVSGAPGSAALTSPTAVTYASIVAAGHPARWDGASETPYAVYRDGTSWHEIWYDDPVSLALKTALAADLRLGGVGAWALGQQGGAASMLEALDGGRPPLKLPVAPR
jgi:hypothetical protein